MYFYERGINLFFFRSFFFIFTSIPSPYLMYEFFSRIVMVIGAHVRTHARARVRRTCRHSLIHIIYDERLGGIDDN